MYNMTREERKQIGQAGRDHVLKNYNFDNFEKSWVKLITDLHDKHGSWETRKGYKPWQIMEME